MIAVFGANGKTGREIIREALHRGVEVRPVVRDDYDTAHLDDIVNVNELCFADADQSSSIPPALEGCDAVVCCIDARTAGCARATRTKVYENPERSPRATYLSATRFHLCEAVRKMIY